MCLKCVSINSILTSFCAYIFAELSGGITLTARYICVSVYGRSLSLPLNPSLYSESIRTSNSYGNCFLLPLEHP